MRGQRTAPFHDHGPRRDSGASANARIDWKNEARGRHTPPPPLEDECNDEHLTWENDGSLTLTAAAESAGGTVGEADRLTDRSTDRASPSRPLTQRVPLSEDVGRCERER